MEEKIKKIKEEALKEIESSKDFKSLTDLKIKYLGKKSELSLLLKKIGAVEPEKRKEKGKTVNQAFEEIKEKLTKDLGKIKEEELQKEMEKEKVDITLPGKTFKLGKKHPLTIVLDEINDIFVSMGFTIVDGPEIETDYYNFEALNIPKNHPARDTQDTFYVSDNLLLRSQTSPVQVRVMEKTSPPIKIISPGRVYRADEIDSTHSPVFHQVEGLLIDKNVSMANLKKTLEIFVKKLYGDETKTRFRPHHFPFTEPSAEMDISCFKCGGSGCSLCKNEGYIEILGCGMVHPDVLKRCNIDPEIYSGFAFGLGLERIVMMRYNINDLRLFYENDTRFLQQF